MAEKERKSLSKAIARALRHEPWLYELELDDGGWVAVDDLLAALRALGRRWRELSRADVEAMMSLSDKQRYELTGNRIRALYGHSLPGKLLRGPAAPPRVLFHGTSPEAAEVIRREGLRPMGRQYVHLSVDLETATEVGRRKAVRPQLLEVAAGAAHDAGLPFYSGNDKVWLADLVSPEFIRVLESDERN